MYNPFLVYCRELAPGTVSLTGDRAQGDDSKHDSHYTVRNTASSRLCPSHTHTYGLLRRVSDQTAVVRRKMRAGPNFLMRLQDAITYSCG